MRFAISTLLGIGLLACGSSHHSSPDASTDSSQQGAMTLTISTYRASGPINIPLVAVQDGDGPWTVLTGTMGVYTATLHDDRYGVVTSCVTSASSGVDLWYGAVSDATTLYVEDCADPGPAVANISGTVTGAAAGDPMSVLDGYFGETDLAAGMTMYTLSTYAVAQRLIAEELVDTRPVKLATVDGIVTDGATIDFDLTAGFAPATQALTGNWIEGAELSYRDADGVSVIDIATTPFDTFRAFPADKLGSGLDRLVITGPNGSGVIRYFKTPADQQVTLPTSPLLMQQPIASATPYPNVGFTVPVQADTTYDLYFSTTNTTNITRGFSIEMTPAWVAKKYPGGAPIAYTAPDLHALAGWSTDYQPEAGIALDWTISPTKYTNIDWFPSVPPGTLYAHDGGELAFTNLVGQLPAP